MTFDPESPIQLRWRDLAEDAPRAVWFEALRDAIREYYLSAPDDPYRASGRGKGAERWVETRRLLSDGIDRSGDYLDVGCANGLLLGSLVDWASAAGHRVVPHGFDFVPELIELARARHPSFRRNFAVANVFDWEPQRRYDWVRTNLEYVPAADRATMVRRLMARAVAPGGTLVVCHYRNPPESNVDCARFAQRLGLDVERRGQAPGVDVAWVRAPS